MTSRRSFLRSLSLLPLAPSVLSQVAVSAAVAAPAPELPRFYLHDHQVKMRQLMMKCEEAIMAGNINGPALAKMTNI